MTGAEIMKHRRKMNYTTDKLAQKVGVTVNKSNTQNSTTDSNIRLTACAARSVGKKHGFK